LNIYTQQLAPLIKSSGSVQLEFGALAEAALPGKITDE
jgi:hypothetical protein